ncbi:class I SAM-dependent methyltransferase [Malikia spinosa]|uniref:Class I SAM-dependent methyltransferase n=2 Tax=Malikia spinosa TaxID=86180 RepID=A0A7C9IXI0_9BURK|nr:class I SAM-dependent methyltransferase [Malikia spinosa]MYZ52409.1 class I SAM-dependent methyltransferase [Malikia spinosa]
MYAVDQLPLQSDELEVLNALVPLSNQSIVELGCGNALLARNLLQRFPGCQVTGLEVDAVQHAKNLTQPQAGLNFVTAGAQDVPFPDAMFDLALMLKSLHHVPLPLLSKALAEVARVLKPGGHFYVSEPIYDGAFNEVLKIFNDEGVVRAAAQAALDEALTTSGDWETVTERSFALQMPFSSFDDFEQRMMRPTYAQHDLSEAVMARVHAEFKRHLTPEGARLVLPIHVRLFRRTGA